MGMLYWHDRVGGPRPIRGLVRIDVADGLWIEVRPAQGRAGVEVSAGGPLGSVLAVLPRSANVVLVEAREE